jgi:hypothetical protein
MESPARIIETAIIDDRSVLMPGRMVRRKKER